MYLGLGSLFSEAHRGTCKPGVDHMPAFSILSAVLFLKLMLCSGFSRSLLADPHWSSQLSESLICSTSFLLCLPYSFLHPYQGSWLKLQGHMLQEGHEMGRASLYLLQALELAVLIF